ncbi:MAG: alpha/beta hydrolase [Flavobacteriales bacterium]|nr:alpha/beta hydrolase [Flavobacteriales bacterium]
MKQPVIILFLLIPSFFFAQTEEELVLKSKPSNLYGTLLVPDNHSSTVVLIIGGSGPTDRDGNSAGGTGKNNSLKYLAENLAKEGVASLRIDKRGVAKSLSAAAKEEDLRFDTYINDVIDWGFQLLNDTRFKKLVVAGHSEGSLIGMVACQELDAAGYISLAGTGFSIDEIITKQMEAQSDSVKTEMAVIFKELNNGKIVKNVSVELLSLFRPSIQPYFISWLKYDPAVEIAKLNIPVLIINGTTDIQVGVDNAEKLHEVSPTSELIIIEGMNHIFKEAPTDRDENIATYSDPKLKNVPQLNEAVVKFVKSL